MRDEQIALARRVVACKGWRWMPGMLTQNGSRIYDVIADDDCYGDTNCHEWQNEHGWGINRCDYHRGRPLAETSAGHLWLDVVLPDLTDPATVGCLLTLVREAWDCDGMHTRRGGTSNKQWHVRYDGSRSKQKAVGIGYSEAEALVAALEAAP